MASKNGVITDPQAIDEVLERGTIVEVLPSKEEFRASLLRGEKMRFYIGFDATAPILHLSHAKNFILMEKFRQLGHEVIILFGDFTARIGDPTGESAARKQLTAGEVKKNVREWKRLIGPLMDFKDIQNPPRVVYNSKWLSALRFEDILELASNFTVQQMLARDMFRKRLRGNQPIYLHEFLYPLMQGYDSVAMDVDVEVCGTDQTFNALVGRDLVKKKNGKEKFVVTVTLMENPVTGELMSKSKGTGVFLGNGAQEMYGQVMAQPDEMMESLFVNNTALSLKEISTIIASEKPRDAKARLAFEITKIFYGEAATKKAADFWNKTFSKKETPEALEEVMIPSGIPLDEALQSYGVVASKSEFRRLIQGGAVRDLETGERINDPKRKIVVPLTLKLGKRTFVRIIIKRKPKH